MNSELDTIFENFDDTNVVDMELCDVLPQPTDLIDLSSPNLSERSRR